MSVRARCGKRSGGADGGGGEDTALGPIDPAAAARVVVPTLGRYVHPVDGRGSDLSTRLKEINRNHLLILVLWSDEAEGDEVYKDTPLEVYIIFI